VQLRTLWCEHLQEQRRLLLSKHAQVQLRPQQYRHLQEQPRFLCFIQALVQLRSLVKKCPEAGLDKSRCSTPSSCGNTLGNVANIEKKNESFEK